MRTTLFAGATVLAALLALGCAVADGGNDDLDKEDTLADAPTWEVEIDGMEEAEGVLDTEEAKGVLRRHCTNRCHTSNGGDQHDYTDYAVVRADMENKEDGTVDFKRHVFGLKENGEVAEGDELRVVFPTMPSGVDVDYGPFLEGRTPDNWYQGIGEDLQVLLKWEKAGFPGEGKAAYDAAYEAP